MTTICVTKTGEDIGFCREYFKDINSGQVYAKQEEAPGNYVWYTTTPFGEPETRVQGIDFVEV